MTKRLAGCVAALTLAAAGCAGGDGGERLSRAEFVSQADAICRTYEARLDALGRPTSVAELRSFAERALPIAREGRERLGELRPPEELEDSYDGWLEQGDRSLEIVEALKEAAEDGDTAEIQRIASEAEAIDREANRLAEEIGFEQCGAAGSPAP